MPTLTAELAPTGIHPQLLETESLGPTHAAHEASEGHEDSTLANLRLLTEVAHFLRYMDPNGTVPNDVFEAVLLNRKTAISEIAMPYAVTTTEHEVVERTNEAGRRERVIMWLGKTAIEVAESGYHYHFSPEAYKRVAIEVAEARHAQQTLRAGIAQAFISPRMSVADASQDIAKAEHLHTDDSLRVSIALTDAAGNVIGRRLQSVLVRDIPLAAWVAMLQDPDNIFGKAFILRDTRSATSIMELFAGMELPEDKLPEGPVTLVEAVLPYVKDAQTQEKVKHQLKRFRGSQELYEREADWAGREWAEFDLELAHSIRTGWATDPIRFFLLQNASAWTGDSLRTIEGHCLGDGQYIMSTELAALIARGKQKLIGDRLSVVTDNEAAIKEVTKQDRQRILANHEALVRARMLGADAAYIRSLEQQQYRLLHEQKIDSGGGCPGKVKNAFDGLELTDGVGENENPFKENPENRADWKWKQGVCQVKACPSPKPTEVGPCSVCRHCQAEFDAGRDPTRKITRHIRNVGAAILGLFSGVRRSRNEAGDKS
jgi:hypothetical protein